MAVKTLLCLGDSITDCGRLWDFPTLGNGYVSILSTQLNSTSQDNWKILNKGMDGFTICRVLEQVQTDPIFLSADVVTLLIGINDIGLMMNTGRSSQQIEHMLHNFAIHYRDLLSVLSNHKPRILLMEPFIFPYPAEYEVWQPYVERMSDSIRKLSEEFCVPYIKLQSGLLEMCEQFGYSNVTTDGIHITTLGHAYIADQVIHRIESQAYNTR